MSETKSAGGFTGDPAAALDVAGTSGCCGNPAQANLSLPEPDGNAGGTCCGTVAEAKAENACCGSAAKTDAVAAGSGCCG